jgi:hypothetical protein
VSSIGSVCGAVMPRMRASPPYFFVSVSCGIHNQSKMHAPSALESATQFRIVDRSRKWESGHRDSSGRPLRNGEPLAVGIDSDRGELREAHFESCWAGIASDYQLERGEVVSRRLELDAGQPTGTGRMGRDDRTEGIGSSPFRQRPQLNRRGKVGQETE